MMLMFPCRSLSFAIITALANPFKDTYAGYKNPKWRRSIWLVLSLGAIGALGYYSAVLFDAYFDYETNSRVRLSVC